MTVVDTDLGDGLCSCAMNRPVTLCFRHHIKKEEVGEHFTNTSTQKLCADPNYLTGQARHHLRGRFMDADAGITGVNLQLPKTGGFVVCTNEGNADLGVSLPKIHIACMGIEKFLPRLVDLAVFTRICWHAVPLVNRLPHTRPISMDRDRAVNCISC